MKRKNWIKNLWAILLAACLLFGNVPVAALATEAESEAYVVDQNTICLSTPEDLVALARNCISDAWSRDKVIVLNKDLDVSGMDIPSIPTFGGVFLGQGHTISGLKLTGEQNALGFFRYLQKTAVVEDLHLTGIIRPDGKGNLDVGGLVGVNSGTVKNCSFTGTVSGTERIGGIAGRNKVSGILEGCTVQGTVHGDHYIGGIAGENQGVIRDCVNEAEGNTHVDHNSVSAVLSGLRLEGFTPKESTSDATNIGGIAGTNSGVIRNCENRADIGYEKMGYNVGGIAGSQIGYITECENYGTINGSNGVGGIVGQFKPNVVLNFGENYMSTMTDQMIGMMGSMTGLMNSMDSLMGSLTFDKTSLEESMDLLKDPENWDPENMDPDAIHAAVNEMSKSYQKLYQDLLATGSNMTSQMQGMMGSMGGMVNTMEKLNEGLNFKIIDISKEDTPENTLTKVSLCSNYGAVHGETYVGGITGIADLEDTTAQEEITGQLNFSTEGEMILRLVIRDCTNAAPVCATKRYAGGIVGNMTIGAVFGGKNTGSLDAQNADYVGGIAGRSETYIHGSFSRAVLAGNQYVGGIAGFGTEAAWCYAIADLAAATKFAGGILGYADLLPDEQTGRILENRYYLTKDHFGGIDGISYEGAAVPMTLDAFLGMEGLDEAFRTVTIRFAAPGQEDVVRTVPLGGSLSVEELPQLEVGEQEHYRWVLRPNVASEAGKTWEMSTGYLFDQTFEAVFDSKNQTLASEEKTAAGRPLALAVGNFELGTTLSLTPHTESQVPGVTALETWQVTLEDPGVEKLHYLIPAGVAGENLALYVQDASGNWVRRDFTVEGSYIIFHFAHGETGFALELLPEEAAPVAAVVMGAAAGVLALLAAVYFRKRKAKK